MASVCLSRSDPAVCRLFVTTENKTRNRSCLRQLHIALRGYGVFAFCPDCGLHNSLQILSKNLELAVKMLDMAATAEADLASRLIENALEDCVSAFDGFGREVCRVHARKSTDPAKAEKISFQNLEGARQNLSVLFNIDLAAGLASDEWKAAVQGFQKRHLFAHKMGVVDEEYIRRTGDKPNRRRPEGDCRRG